MCRVNCFCFATELLAKLKTLVWGEYILRCEPFSFKVHWEWYWTFMIGDTIVDIDRLYQIIISPRGWFFFQQKMLDTFSWPAWCTHEAYLNWTEIWLTTERMYMMYIFWGMPKSPSFTVGGFSSTVFLSFTTLTGAPLWNLDFPGPKKTILEVSPNFQHLQGDLPGRFGDP